MCLEMKEKISVTTSPFMILLLLLLHNDKKEKIKISFDHNMMGPPHHEKNMYKKLYALVIPTEMHTV